MKHKAQPTPPEQEQVQNPHDRFLKRTLEDLEKVQGTLEGVLPPALFARLNFPTLQKEDTSYIDHKLKQFFSDIVYNCRTVDDIPLKITFLFEHKSYPPDYPHLQLLRYMLEIWDRQVKDKQSLSLVLPILIYHGKEPWVYQPFKNHFPGDFDKDLGKYVPLFDFLVANFQQATYAEINEQFRLPSLRIAFRLMKSIRDENLSEKLMNILEGLTELEKEESERKYFETIIVYLLYGSRIEVEKIMESLYNISQNIGEFADSPAMQLIRKGREEGRAESWAEAKKLIEERQKAIDEAKKRIEEEQRKVIEAKQKAKAEKKATIRRMLKAKMTKALISSLLELKPKQLEGFIKEIEQEEKKRKEEK
ncbi:MAG: Rpn family recombination-promoting nuclease/putative transposase [Bacteroidia bacterium]